VNDTPENRETAGDAALYFRAQDSATLSAALEALFGNPSSRAQRGEDARARARALYRWDAVADAYEKLLAGT
jgi:glycosyltransferase involved in cell wall biosynthesis